MAVFKMVCGAAPAPIGVGSLPAVVVLSATPDPSRTIVAYKWTLRSKPTGSTATIDGGSTSTAATPSLTYDIAGGTYIVDLVAMDSEGAISAGGGLDEFAALVVTNHRLIPETAKYKIRTTTATLVLSKPGVGERDWLPSGLWAWQDAIETLATTVAGLGASGVGLFDFVNELTVGHGVIVDGVELKDGVVTTIDYTAVSAGLKFDRAQAVTPTHGMKFESVLGAGAVLLLGNANGGGTLHATNVISTARRFVGPGVNTGIAHEILFSALTDASDTMVTVLPRPVVGPFLPERVFFEVVTAFDPQTTAVIEAGATPSDLTLVTSDAGAFTIEIIVSGISTVEDLDYDSGLQKFTITSGTDGAGAATTTVGDVAAYLSGFSNVVSSAAAETPLDIVQAVAATNILPPVMSVKIGNDAGIVSDDGFLVDCGNLRVEGYQGNLPANKGGYLPDPAGIYTDPIIAASLGDITVTTTISGGVTHDTLTKGKLRVYVMYRELPVIDNPAA